MMNLTWFPTFQDHGYCCSLLGLDQMLLHSGNSQQRRDCNMVLIHTSVGENQNVGTVTVGTVCLNKQTVNGFLQTCVFIINDRNNANFESFFFHMLDFQKVCICQDRIFNFQYLTVFRLFFQNISILTDVNRCRCNNFLTDSIDWRVCNLCKQLFEVIKQRLMIVG